MNNIIKLVVTIMTSILLTSGTDVYASELTEQPTITYQLVHYVNDTVEKVDCEITKSEFPRLRNITIKNITDIEDCKYTCTITVVDDKDYTKTLEYNFGGTDGEKIENGTISLDIPSNKRFCISFNTYEYEYEEVCDPVAEVLVDGRAMIPDCYIDDYNKDEYEQYEDTINFYGVDCTNTYTFAVAK